MGVEYRTTRPDQYTVAVSGHLCECGCGERTMVAPRTISSRGVRKGDPRRFVKGHVLAGLSPARPVREAAFRLVVVKVRGSRRCACGCGQRPSSKNARYASGHAPAVRGRVTPLRADNYVEEDRGFETPCWVWRGRVDHWGYGRMVRQGRYYGAHRVSYELRVGPVPEGHDLHHRCEVKSCVNPAHLQPLTPEEHREVHRAAR